MIFVFPITTPAGTASNNALVTTLNLTAGTITRIDIQYPLGVSGLAHIFLNYGLAQLFPSNTGGSFATSSETISWEEDYDLLQPPYSLVAFTWNDDPNWQHTITVRIVMTPATPGGPSLLDQVKSLLGVAD